MRLVRRVTIAWRDRGRNMKPELAPRPAIQNAIGKPHDCGFARCQVAHVHGVKTRLDLFEHHGAVALFNGGLVALLGLGLCSDFAFESALAQLDLEVEQHGIERERKGVDRLDI